MTRQYKKTKVCGCVIKSIVVDVQNTTYGKMYMLGGHNNLIICDICKNLEDKNEDILYDMWINDNMTNDFGYMQWYQYDGK